MPRPPKTARRTEGRASARRQRPNHRELETSKEEVKSSNEELLSTNDELQSANEELQISKEELESINEELSKKVEELDAANADLQNLFQGTQIPTLFLDGELRIKRFTEAAVAVFKLIEADVGRPITDIAPRFVSDLVTDVHDVLRTHTIREREVRTPDGSASYLMRVLPYRQMDRVVEGVVLTFLDVTALNRALEQQARLASIVASSQDPIVGHSFDGTIIAWNEAATLMFGYAEREALGAPVSLILRSEEAAELERIYDQLRDGGRVKPFETVRHSQDGRAVNVSIAVSAIRDGAGRPVGASEIFRDITELKQAQVLLRQEAHDKDQFLAMLSHELRNPLAPLRTSLELLSSNPLDAGVRQRSLSIMERQLAQLTSLVDQLLDAARIASGKILLNPEELDLAALVREAVEDHRRLLENAGLQIDLDLPDRQVHARADRVRLAQAIGNLLVNAAKFTQGGGRVGVSLRPDRTRHQASITISDTGIGIDPGMRPHLFEPFTQAAKSHEQARGGLGLGLWLVKGLVEAHGGSVDVRSAGPGQGTEFTISLPMLSRDQMAGRHAPESGVASERIAATPRRILIVEDNEDAAESLRRLLEIQGHSVTTAANGRGALEAFGSFRPEVVLCDLQLPGEMDGFAVASALRSDSSDSPYLIALTGYGQPQDRQRSREAGFDWHLIKPPNPKELKRLLAELPRGQRS